VVIPSRRQFEKVPRRVHIMIMIRPYLFAILPLLTYAFPGGAGGCGTGNSAALPGHGEPSGSLSDGGYTVSISTVGDDIMVSLVGGTFRGFLIRMDNVEIESFDVDAQVSSVCSGATVGVTHTSPDDKTGASATFSTTGPGTYLLEVTVVQTASSTFYESFSIIIQEPETPAPTTPTEEPSLQFTPEPTDETTLAPTTLEPSTQVTEAPVTPEPSTQVTEAPITPAPTESDTPAPTEAPIASSISPSFQVVETLSPTGDLMNFTNFTDINCTELLLQQNMTNATNTTLLLDLNCTAALNATEVPEEAVQPPTPAPTDEASPGPTSEPTDADTPGSTEDDFMTLAPTIESTDAGTPGSTEEVTDEPTEGDATSTPEGNETSVPEGNLTEFPDTMFPDTPEPTEEVTDAPNIEPTNATMVPEGNATVIPESNATSIPVEKVTEAPIMAPVAVEIGGNEGDGDDDDDDGKRGKRDGKRQRRRRN